MCQFVNSHNFRLDVLSASALRIQTIWRGYVARKRYQIIRQAVMNIQAIFIADVLLLHA